eukprot:jgi/Botrbrau1/2658/Bobra.0203s0008.2
MGLLTIIKKVKRKEKEIRILIVFRLNIWDVGGQKTLRAYWRNYFEQTDALVWVVDCADRQRVEDCRAELANLLKEERLAGATFVVLANKQDIPGAMTSREVEKVLDLAALKNRHYRVVACSAITGAGLPEAFDWMVADVRSRIYSN